MKKHTTEELKETAVYEYTGHPGAYTDIYFQACYELADRGVGHGVDKYGNLVFKDMKGGEDGTK